jgi:hypothetical protein
VERKDSRSSLLWAADYSRWDAVRKKGGTLMMMILSTAGEDAL